ncbi:hypothetical protein LCGC14_1414010 [marine sediment metagenome]|uniref:Uncharacterized protein n=1 Tax=marine sediment metagenome TaxID=412755 RepID=A0A0F9MV28_9ZZZZ|nr:hypothetical protein [archaeon]
MVIEPLLREELEEIWESFKAKKDFNLESVYSFITSLMDFLHMIYGLAELPKPQLSIRFTDLKSFADPFRKYYNSDEGNDK